MKKLFFLPLLLLASCGGVPIGELQACTNALVAANTSNIGVLLATAEATPACQALAADALQALIAAVGGQQKAKGLR